MYEFNNYCIKRMICTTNVEYIMHNSYVHSVETLGNFIGNIGLINN